MELEIREYCEADLPGMAEIWNAIVEQGDSFPQEERMALNRARAFFQQQTFSGVAVDETGALQGLYILHPNNVGRCAHIANASYGVRPGCRGYGVGERLVRHSLKMCARFGFRGLQFNAVVCTNRAAIHLYEKLGFTRLGVTPEGYRMKDGSFQDLWLFISVLLNEKSRWGAICKEGAPTAFIRFFFRFV